MIRGIMTTSRTILLLTALVGLVFPAAAHDLHGLGDKSVRLSKDLNVNALQKLAEPLDPDAKYVYSRLLLWNPGQKLKACFYGGSSEEKALVLASVAKLLDGKNVNIAIDFGAAPDFRSCTAPGTRSDIRVSFSGGCCAAYIGRTSHHPDVKDGPSVMLQGIATDYSPDTAQQTTMHEIMHALGFDHEHQSPAAKCEPEFIKDAVLSAYGWTNAEYETNLKQLNQDSHSYTWSSYDPLSIMKYFFKSSFLKNGEASVCYSKENLLPSDRDYEGLRLAYPMGPAVVSPERARGILGDVNGSSAPQAVKDLARELRKLDDGP
ncbi:M12 family metallopeptidase [Bradyrhizobium sp. USDA 4502]